jgi:hypothetical protein
VKFCCAETAATETRAAITVEKRISIRAKVRMVDRLRKCVMNWNRAYIRTNGEQLMPRPRAGMLTLLANV